MEAYWLAEKYPSRRFQQRRSCAPYSGTDKVFSRWNYSPQGTTINSAVYCETLKRLRSAIQSKRRGMQSAAILLFHYDARPHCAAQAQELITSFKWEQMDHPTPYSPVSPSDYLLFPHLKKSLGGKRFDDDANVKDAVHKWLTPRAAAFYEEGIQKLVSR